MLWHGIIFSLQMWAFYVHLRQCDHSLCPFMPPQRSGRRHYVFGLPVHPYIRPVLVIARGDLNNWLTDSHQTWYMYVSWGAKELIRFWGHEVKGNCHRAHNQWTNSILGSWVQRPKVTGLIIKIMQWRRHQFRLRADENPSSFRHETLY